ncbi:MAG TPA: hypothetical protein DCR93_37125, partial [Cytophagales bacterium]|nr:hypothetical protein [Cytophagales bacterium]
MSDVSGLDPGSSHLLVTQRAIRHYIDTKVDAREQKWQEELTGTVNAFAMDQAPVGWLPCDGRAID